MSQYPRGARAALTLVSALAGLSAAVPAGLAAQDNDGPGRVTVLNFSRPRIGVRVDTRADAEKDKIGARVESVTEGGPADKAGLKDGDIITRFNGVALGGVKPESDEDESSGPGLKLISLAQKLDAGDTVDVEYRRGTDNRKTKIIAADMSDMAMGRFRTQEDMPGMRGMTMPRIQIDPTPGPNGMRLFEGGPGSGDVRFFFNNRAEGGLDLADLNSDLGEYFGAREGVLVLKAPADSAIPLRAGDVILSVDGRPTKSEEQARRILRSYGNGETAKVEILRKQKKMTLSWKPAPPEERMRMRTRRDGPPPERS